MKKTLTLLLAVASVSAKAQITLQHTFPIAKSIMGMPVLFTSNGTKLAISDSGSIDVKLYNTDYSLWKNMTPPPFSGYKFGGFSVVSDNLFNSDNLVEYVAYYVTTAAPAAYKSVVVNEAGTVIQDLGDCLPWGVFYVDGVHKLYTYRSISTPSNHTQISIYALPGSLPCGHCGTMGSTKTPNVATASASMSAPMPNPSNGMVTIKYTLPEGIPVASLTVYTSDGKQVSSYVVNALNDQMEIDGSKLAPGVYYFTISGEGMLPVTEKMVITK